MKKMIRYSFIAAIAAVSLSSCKKDEKTRMELITAGNWKIVSDQVKFGNGNWEEFITGYEACELDNYIKFNTNNTVEGNEGATKCSPDDPQSMTGQWSFANGESQISMFGEVANIDELNESTIVTSSSETFNGTTYYYKQVYKH